MIAVVRALDRGDFDLAAAVQAHFPNPTGVDLLPLTIAALLVMAEVGQAGQPLSVVREPFERYSSSGEINTQVDDAAAVIERVRAEFAEHPSDEIDGLTVDYGDWWFNLRPSNTEPLLRLNLEAADRNACDDRVAQLLALITA